MSKVNELKKQIEELEKQIESYEYNPYDFEKGYIEFLNESGKIVIDEITFDPAYVLKELDPIAYREGLLNYADAVYEEDQDQYFNDLHYEREQLLEELEELTEEIKEKAKDYINELYYNSNFNSYDEFLENQKEFFSKNKSYISDCFIDTALFGDLQKEIEEEVYNQIMN